MPRRRSRSRSARPTLPRFAKSVYARRLRAELLEDRRMLATLVIQNNLDGDLAALAGDGELSLREAIAIANDPSLTIDGFTSADAADTIEFDPAAFTGGAASLVRLTAGELVIRDTLTIDGSTGVGVTISGDHLGDDIVDVNFITDVAASLAEDDLLDDNSRVLNFLAYNGDLTLESITITGGRTRDADQNGGGIHFGSNRFLSLLQSTVSGNSTLGNDSEGGGIYTRAGDVTLNQSTLSGNSTSGSNSEGGGIHARSGDVTLNQSTLSGNSTSGFNSSGGGIVTFAGALTITRSTLSDNRTFGRNSQGGGIATFGEEVTLTSSTVSGNSTSGIDSEGGGIYTSGEEVRLTSSTITGNSSGISSGGGVYIRGAFFTDPLLTIHNSIVAGNTGGEAPDLRVDPSASLAIQFSLIGNTAGSGIDEAFLVAPFIGNLLNIDPLLGPLADNGGPTLTHALQPVSSAIDAGNSTLSTDQRGLARRVDFTSLSNGAGNGSDIGAVEASSPANTMLAVPDSAIVAAETPTSVDLTRVRIIREDGFPLTVTLTASDGFFSPPTDGTGIGAGVTASQTTPQSVTLTGSALDLNAYFATPRAILYTSAVGATGDNAATLTVQVDSGPAATIAVDVNEPLLVTTAADTTDPLDGLTSLREAIDQANNTPGGEVIRFEPTVFTGGAASLIRLSGRELEITDTLTIDGSTGVEVTITGDVKGDDVLIDATFVSDVSFSGPLDDNSRVFHFTSDRGDLALVGITVTGGFDDFFLSFEGGAGIRFLSNGLLELRDSVVSGNRAVGLIAPSGGGIRTLAGDVSLHQTTVADNRSNHLGGGIFTDSGDITVIDSIFERNFAYEGGGGIATSSGEITITGSVIGNNTTFRASGGGVSSSSGAVTLIASELHNNFSDSDGGAISSDSGAITLIDSLVDRNFAGWSRSGGNGGGIRTDSGPIVITRSTVSNNDLGVPFPASEDAVRRGAGVSTNSGDVTVTASTISGNLTGNGSGGGLYTLHGDLLITDSTIANNSAFQGSGGLLVGAQGTASVTIRNSIVAANTTAPSTTDALPGADLKAPPTAILEIDYSLIGDTTNSGIDATVGANNLFDVDPLLGILADNGGPTPSHALLPSSPAIDAGDSALMTDQRGLPRPFDLTAATNRDGNLSDIGAVEVQQAADSPSLVVTTNSDRVDSFDGLTSLREAVLYVNGDLVNGGTITFDPTVFSGGAESLIRLTEGTLDITQSLTIDGRTAQGVTVTGDANGDDITDGSFITDVAASFGGMDGAADDLLDDNARVIRFSNATEDLTLAGITLTGGRTRAVENVLPGDFGGGVFFPSEGTLTLVDSTVSGNSVTGSLGRGGGVYSLGGAIVITRSTLSGNAVPGANAAGGAIAAITNSVTITGSTISGNQSGGSGGGIATGGALLTLINSTVVNNESTRGGGVQFFDGDGESTLSIQSTIVAGNTTPEDGSGPDLSIVSEMPLDIRHSLIGDTTGSGIDAATGIGNLLNVDPLLGPLADNGGPTLTHAPLLGSPLIDAGEPDFVTTTGVDQRGNPFARVAGGRVDIGAVEVQQTPTFAVGDYNRDGVVNTADYAAWRATLDPTTPVTPLSGADGDGDGFVTRRDRDVWLSHAGFAFTPPAPGPIAAEPVAEAPPLQQPAFLEPEPVTTPAEPSPLATIDSAFAMLSPLSVPQAPPVSSASEATMEAPIQNNNLLLLEFGVPDGLAEEADNPFADDKAEEEPGFDEALAVALGAFE